MTQIDKAQAFAELHAKGNPIVLYNIWDAGSAKAVADAGAKAVATGSWSVAAAQGYRDGEAIPLDLAETIIGRIVASVDVPVSVDFEGGYAAQPDGLAQNVARIIAAGAVGVNFEDQVVGGDGLYSTEEQAQRVAAVRQAADTAGVPLFINARTDLFLKEPDRDRHAGLLEEAIERAQAYEKAGASGFFVPALVHPDLIRTACDAVSLPLNIMMMGGAPSIPELAELGVSRISYGPKPYRDSIKAIADRFAGVQDAAKSP